LVGQYGGRIDRIAGRTAVEVLDDLVGDIERDVHLCFLRAGSKMRSDDHLRELQQRVVLRRRLLVEDVDGGTGDVAVRDRLRQRALVDDAAPGDIYNASTLFHASQLACADDASRGVVQRHVHGQDIALGEQRVEITELNAGLVG